MPNAARNSARRLVVEDSATFRSFRLYALKTCPEAFGAAWEDELAQPLNWFSGRIERNIIIGGFDAGQKLVGTAALFPSEAPKTRHKGIVWGVFVSPAARGAGLASRLLDIALSEAAHVVEEARLTVGTSNASAIELYKRAGFIEYGTEPRALKVADQYHDEYLMGRCLRDRRE
jgi:ribosomal protein S18 acetylase RimI-like enzyme